jgi:hypothetical protein
VQEIQGLGKGKFGKIPLFAVEIPEILQARSR